MTREAEQCLLVAGALEYLIDEKLINGKKRMTPIAIHLFDQLKASGRRPSLIDIENAFSSFHINDEDGIIITLINGFFDRKIN